MFDWVRRQVLRFMRVPRDPEPPFGAPGSVRAFRAGPNYFKVLLLRWGLGQAGATIGLCFSLLFFWWFQSAVETALRIKQEAAAAAASTPVATAAPAPVPVPPPADKTAPRKKRVRSTETFTKLAERTPRWVLLVLRVVELGGVVIFLVQIPVTLAAVKLEFELHWYIVTDRSLRIRSGIFSVRESTMSFANLQQVEVKQGPLQRLLGLADVHVQSAGGGGDHAPHGAGDSLHLGVFHGVEHAREIRDLILARLRQFRETGLGDPDDAGGRAPVATAPAPDASDALAAARELLAETRALRQAVSC
jgi:hypothetical protein